MLLLRDCSSACAILSCLVKAVVKSASLTCTWLHNMSAGCDQDTLEVQLDVS